MREECAGARDVFFGMKRVKLIFGFAAFVGDGQNAKAMDRGSGRAEARRRDTQVIPGEVHGIDHKEKSGQGSSDTNEKTNSRRG